LLENRSHEAQRLVALALGAPPFGDVADEHQSPSIRQYLGAGLDHQGDSVPPLHLPFADVHRTGNARDLADEPFCLGPLQRETCERLAEELLAAVAVEGARRGVNVRDTVIGVGDHDRVRRQLDELLKGRRRDRKSVV
jgi:hypothetical protein